MDDADWAHMRLMIVDDHESTREMIRRFLDFPGMTYCECSSGEEALTRAREFKPTWVTMDVHMPGLNGFKTTEVLRQAHPSARVMMVTSDNQPHFRQLSREVGAVGIIAKENLMALRMMLAKEITNRSLAQEIDRNSSAGTKGKNDS
jgi:DNA-binding NarL/FixJ family response regulator